MEICSKSEKIKCLYINEHNSNISSNIDNSIEIDNNNLIFHIPWKCMRNFYAIDERIPTKYIKEIDKWIIDNPNIFLMNPVDKNIYYLNYDDIFSKLHNIEPPINNKIKKIEPIIISNNNSIIIRYYKGDIISLIRSLKYISRDVELHRNYNEKNKRKDTKFTYYMIIYMSALNNNMIKNTLKSKIDINNYTTVYNTKDKLMKNISLLLTSLRKDIISLIKSLKFEEFKKYYFEKENELVVSGSKLRWGMTDILSNLKLEYYFVTGIYNTINKTKFIEKILDIYSRAYNVNKGNSIYIISRNLINPSKLPIINKNALFLLLLHEVSHTISPLPNSDLNINYKQLHIIDYFDNRDPHGIEFQITMVFLYNKAKELNFIENINTDTYSNCEMFLRESFQNSYLNVEK